MSEEIDNTYKNLCGLALRKYTEKGYFQNSLLISLMCDSKNYLPKNSELHEDIPTLKKLIAGFH